jgi:hypothetical protein
VRELYLENASDSLNTAQDSLILAIDARQQEIADQLEPPVVSDVKVSSVREGYYNKTKVTWTTSAEPIETSVQIDEYVNRDGAQLSDGFYNYLSVVPSVGEVAIPGNPRRGTILQNYGLFPWKTVIQNISTPRKWPLEYDCVPKEELLFSVRLVLM